MRTIPIYAPSGASPRDMPPNWMLGSDAAFVENPALRGNGHTRQRGRHDDFLFASLFKRDGLAHVPQEKRAQRASDS